VTDRRRTFVPVAGGGLAAGVLLAVASARPWVTGTALAGDPFDTVADAGKMPLASALSLVLLACWGVVLFTRRVVRRSVAGLALLTALGALATVVVGYTTLPDRVADAVTEVGLAHGGGTVATGTTGWFWVAAVTAVASVVATALAVAWSPAWPEMGSRYDAPGTAAPRDDVPPEERSSIDLWKSQDEGRDPTA
jgi:uncharacterized membrane protein (TIGR02234 family)